MIVETLFFLPQDVVVPCSESGHMFIDNSGSPLVRMKGPDGNYIPFEADLSSADWQTVMEAGQTAIGLEDAVTLETNGYITITSDADGTYSAAGVLLEAKGFNPLIILDSEEGINLNALTSISLTCDTINFNNSGGSPLNCAGDMQISGDLDMLDGVFFHTGLIHNVGDAVAEKDVPNFAQIKPQVGSGNPNGGITPRYYGDIFLDGTGEIAYINTDLTINGWAQITN